MDFKLVDKKNMGGASLLLLIIILCQSRFFNFLIDTALGRAILITFIIFICCCHKIMGVIAVLLIIIMFNRSQIGILEGFDSGEINTQQIKDNIQAKIQSATDASAPASTTTTTSAPTTTTTTTSAPASTTTPSTSAPATTTPSTTSPNLASLQSKVAQAKEGFDLIGTESNLKSGKQSNSISVNNKSRSSENVLPSYENIFSTSIYSKF
jgi:apolipoprotein N-acyltransferase